MKCSHCCSSRTRHLRIMSSVISAGPCRLVTTVQKGEWMEGWKDASSREQGSLGRNCLRLECQTELPGENQDYRRPSFLRPIYFVIGKHKDALFKMHEAA